MRHEKPIRSLVHVTGLFPLYLGYNFANTCGKVALRFDRRQLVLVRECNKITVLSERQRTFFFRECYKRVCTKQVLLLYHVHFRALISLFHTKTD